MPSDGFPKRTPSDATGTSGVHRVSTVINDELGWIFRKTDQGDDYGIDGFADIVTATGSVTGQSFAIQIKYGASYLTPSSGDAVTYYGESKHINYYANSSSPVLLVVGNRGEPLIWKLFCIDEIELTDSGWKTEIPKNQVLDESALDVLLEMQGTPVDAKLVATQNKQLSDWLNQVSVFLYAIPTEDIENDYTHNLISFCRRILKNVGVAKNAKGKLEIFTEAFDHDTQEIWEIPKFIRWMEELELEEIPWFYLTYLEPPYNWMTVYFGSLCEGKTGEYYIDDEGNKRVSLQMNTEKMADLIGSNFSRLNEICERLHVPEHEIKRLSYKALTALQIPDEVIRPIFFPNE